MKKKNTTIFVLLFVCFILKAQTQTKDYTHPLDYATLRVTYQATQKATKDNDPITITDTMTLDIGNNWSAYYDKYKALKDSLESYRFLYGSTNNKSLVFRTDEDELYSTPS